MDYLSDMIGWQKLAKHKVHDDADFRAGGEKEWYRCQKKTSFNKNIKIVLKPYNSLKVDSSSAYYHM